MITCVDCFLDGHSLYVSRYVEKHGSSVKSPHEVVHLAYGELYTHDIFGG